MRQWPCGQRVGVWWTWQGQGGIDCKVTTVRLRISAHTQCRLSVGLAGLRFSVPLDFTRSGEQAGVDSVDRLSLGLPLGGERAPETRLTKSFTVFDAISISKDNCNCDDAGFPTPVATLQPCIIVACPRRIYAAALAWWTPWSTRYPSKVKVLPPRSKVAIGGESLHLLRSRILPLWPITASPMLRFLPSSVFSFRLVDDSFNFMVLSLDST